MDFKARMSPDELRQRLTLTLNLPFHRFLKMELLDHHPGRADIRINATENIANVADVVHGGILYAVLDAAAFISLVPLLADHQNAVTHDIHVSVLRPAPLDLPLIFKGRTVKIGKRLAFCDAQAYYGERLVSSARVTKSIVDFKTPAKRH